MGSSGIVLGQVHDEEHIAFHALHPDSIHAHNGHSPHRHHHDPLQKDHEPLPFESADNQWTACPSKISATPNLVLPLDLLAPSKAFAFAVLEKNTHWTHPESPPSHHPPSIAADHQKRAPPLA